MPKVCTIVGGVVSPILANIVLHELDLFMKDLKGRFDEGKYRRKSPPYASYNEYIRRLRKKWDTLKGKEEAAPLLQGIKQEIRRVDRLRKSIPSRDPFDDGYKRLYYCRYADDFCIGIIGSYADAERVRQEVKHFIENSLKLTIAEEKSHIRHSKEGARFLGYWVKTYSGDRVIKVKCGPRHTTRKSVCERIQVHIPPDKPQQFCVSKKYGNYDTMKAIHKREFAQLSDAEIILAYNGELRGLANYYSLAVGAKGKLNKLARIQRVSLFKTLANKHKTSVNKIAKRLKRDDGYALIVKGEHQTRTIRVFLLKDLKPPDANNPRLDTMFNSLTLTLNRSELIRRLNAQKCEYCESTEGPFEVHHIRKMKDVAQGKALWQKMMAARNRKTLILCLHCHQRLHAGTLPEKEYRKKFVKGEPCAATSRQHGSERG